jgi:hypothetical protein
MATSAVFDFAYGVLEGKMLNLDHRQQAASAVERRMPTVTVPTIAKAKRRL